MDFRIARSSLILLVLALVVGACAPGEEEPGPAAGDGTPAEDPDTDTDDPDTDTDDTDTDTDDSDVIAYDGDPHRVRLGHCVSDTHSFHLGAEYLAERLDEIAPGAFEFQLHPNCELGNEVTLFDLYGTADVEMTIQYSSSAASVAPSMGFLAIPFQLDSQEHWERLMLDPGTTDLLNSKLEEDGVNFRVGATGSFGIRNIYARDAIDTSSLDGFRGLRMRETESPIMIRVWQAVGINPVAIPFPELYSALESGVVEAAPNTPVGYELGSHYEVAPHYHFTEHEVTSAFIFYRQDWYTQLPDELQEALQRAFPDVNDYMNEVNLRHNQEALDQFGAWGVESHEVPDDVRQEMADTVAPILEDAASDLGMEDFHQRVQDTR